MSAGTIILIALGGSFAIEGAAWAIFPAQMRRSYEEAFRMGDAVMHRFGLFSVAVGIAMIVWAVQSSA